MQASRFEDIPAIQPPLPSGETRFDFNLVHERIGATPAFPLDLLPRLWGPWCEGVARGAGTSVDYVALALLGSAASLLGGSRRVTPAPGWSEPCTLWTALVGPPSSGKTPAVDAVLRLVRTLEPSAGGDDVSASTMTPTAASSPATSAAPSRPLVVSDSSFEAIAAALQGAPRGVLLARDEHGDWLGHMVRGTRDGRAHAFWLSAWAGRGCNVGQRGRAITLADPAVSILGTAQPEALEQALARDHDGVMARFLFVRPMRVQPQILPATDRAVSPEAVAALRRLRDLPAGRRNLSLSEEAFDIFRDVRHANADGLEDLSGRAADWWGKGPGTVLRLAGILTFLDWAAQPADTAEPAQVPAWALASAFRLWRDVLWPHAQATLRIAGAGGERERHVRKVIAWLRKHRLQVVSRETIRRDALGQALNAAATDCVIDALVEGGWLDPAAPEPGARGRRPLRWHVFAGLWYGPPEPASAGQPASPEYRGSAGVPSCGEAEGDLPPPAASIAAVSAPATRSTGERPIGANSGGSHAPHPEEAAPKRSAGAAVSKGGEQSSSCVQGLSVQRCGSRPFETLAALAPQGEEVGERPKLAPMGLRPPGHGAPAAGELFAPPPAATLSAVSAPAIGTAGLRPASPEAPAAGEPLAPSPVATIPAVSASARSGDALAAFARSDAPGEQAVRPSGGQDDPPALRYQRASDDLVPGQAAISAVPAAAATTGGYPEASEGVPPVVAGARVKNANAALAHVRH